MTAVDEKLDFSQQVQTLFGSIAPRYDFLNCLLSCGRDRYWRKQAVSLLDPAERGRYLDIATGTADIALEIAGRSLEHIRINGLDFCYPMVKLGRQKVLDKELDKVITFQLGCGENLPFPENSFNGVISAFGIRNFADVTMGLDEIHRVLKPGGKTVILEFSLPSKGMIKFIYELYFSKILPWIGRCISGHRFAYNYLPDSVSRFPSRSDFARILENAGFQDVSFKSLTFGIVTLYSGYKHA